MFKHLASKELVKIYDGNISTILPIFERCVCVCSSSSSFPSDTD